MSDTENLKQREQPLEDDIRHRLDQALAAPRPGDGELLARIRQRVLQAIAGTDKPLHQTVRAAGGQWETVGPGLERKLLWESADAISCLMRLAPGAVAAGHAHLMDEECVVLEGTLRIGRDLLLHAGDFHVGVAGLAMKTRPLTPASSCTCAAPSRRRKRSADRAGRP